MSSKWFCENCKCVNENPHVEVNLKVVLNCIGVAQSVRVVLHAETVSRLVNIETITSCLSKHDFKSDEVKKWRRKFLLYENIK